MRTFDDDKTMKDAKKKIAKITISYFIIGFLVGAGLVMAMDPFNSDTSRTDLELTSEQIEIRYEEKRIFSLYDTPQELIYVLNRGTENYDSLPESIKSLVDAYENTSTRYGLDIDP